jgi:thioredoxin reductase (NADPH)
VGGGRLRRGKNSLSRPGAGGGIIAAMSTASGIDRTDRADGAAVRVYDCAIVGGGPAGLSAAVNLARMRRSVLVIDDRDGRSLWSQINRNYLGFPDGIPAAEIRLQGRRQAARYGARFLLGRVTAADRDGDLFRLLVEGDEAGGAGIDAAGTSVNVARDEELGRSLGEVQAGASEEVRARSVVLATGVRDPFPKFDGRDECVGRSLFWCIACDGYESLDKSVAVVGHNEEAVEMALDLLEFTSKITIAAGRPGGFSVPESRLADLAANGIPSYRWRVASYPNENGQIQALILDDPKKTRIPVEMVFTVHTPTARNEIARQLGVNLNPLGQIIVDTEQHTNVHGVYAAGDATSVHDHQVSAAVHEGNQAACAANYFLYRPIQKAPNQEEC